MGWKDDMKLGKPASEEDILRAEKENNFKFPPSYRVFLKKYNGWQEFWPDWCLTGVSGGLSKKMLTDARRSIKNAVSMIKNTAHLEEKNSEEYIEGLKKKEVKDPKVIYPPNHPILGTDFNGSVLVFDRNRCRSDGECQIVAINNQGDITWRWKDFVHLLKDAIKETKKDIREATESQAKRQGKKNRR